MSLVFVCLAAFLYFCVRRSIKDHRPTKVRLGQDLARLYRVVPEVFDDEKKVYFNDTDVEKYYRETTFRDYERSLKTFYGCDAMHTHLEHEPALPYKTSGMATSMMYVISMLEGSCEKKGDENRGKRRHKKEDLDHHLPPSTSQIPNIHVLEIGYGKGSNAIFLASLFPHVRVTGLDLLEEHCEYARHRALQHDLQERVNFYKGDATNPPHELWYEKDDNCGSPRPRFDLIYAVESLCHLDSADKRERFTLFCRTMLKKEGRLVIVDGFRPSLKTWTTGIHDSARKAMCSAEAGFRINAMPSREEWVAVCSRNDLVPTRYIDLTEEAGRFWIKWWIPARLILHVTPIGALRWFAKGFPESYANFVAVCMTAHAFESGAAEYGMCAFVNRNKT